MVTDVAKSVSLSGVPALVLVNGHGGNYVLSNIVQETNAQGSRMAFFPSAQDWKDARSAAHLESTMHEDMHAGELEASILLHSHPELVRDGYETAYAVTPPPVSSDVRHSAQPIKAKQFSLPSSRASPTFSGSWTTSPPGHKRR